MANPVEPMVTEAKRIEKNAARLGRAHYFIGEIQKWFAIALVIAGVVASIATLAKWDPLSWWSSVILLILSAINGLFFAANWGQDEFRNSRRFQMLANNARDFYSVRAAGAGPSNDLDRAYQAVRDFGERLNEETMEQGWLVKFITTRFVSARWSSPAANPPS
jgi:hypothetical protein